MDALIYPGRLTGRITPPSSKSFAHRALIAAFLSGGPCRVDNVIFSDDVNATLGCIRVLGADFRICGDSVIFTGKNEGLSGGVCDCNESGSTLRFLLPVAAALGKKCLFTGTGRLPERSYKELALALNRGGARISPLDGLPVAVDGRISCGDYTITGSVSSQFATGLLFALPLLEGDSRIIIMSPLQSASYVEITLDVLKTFGVTARKTDYGYFVKGNQKYKSTDYTVETDYSAAAFFIAAKAMGHEVETEGLNPFSVQGDKAVETILKRGKNGRIKAFDADLTDTPDLLPVLAVAAAYSDGICRLTGAARVRLKECDRISASAQNLKKAGIDVTELDDGLIIAGGKFRSAKLDGYGDHRMVMASAIAALGADGPVSVTDVQAVSKSYPSFFTDFAKLGGKADVR